MGIAYILGIDLTKLGWQMMPPDAEKEFGPWQVCR